MLANYDYYHVRALQICIVFTCSQVLESYFHFTHSGWIGFAVMMIYAGFDSGASIHRSKHRFWGAILGLLLSYFLFLFIRINDDLIWLVIPFILFLAYFTVSKLYVTPTIFTVSLTGLGADYYQNNGFPVQTFFEEYFFSTLIAYWLCITLEYFVFKKNELSNKFYQELQDNLIVLLEELFGLVSAERKNNSVFLKRCADLDTLLTRLETFIKTSKHSFVIKQDFYRQAREFDELAEQVYKNLHVLYINDSGHRDKVQKDTQNILIKLRDLIQE